MLTGKTILLGVTGSISAYKMANVASTLAKMHADVHVLMTEHAARFINPIVFDTLTGNKCLTDLFDRTNPSAVEHVRLGEKADVFMVAPASADAVAKLAYGLADDALTSTFIACRAPKLIAPAMNVNMYENPAVQRNLDILRQMGAKIIEPAEGILACKAVGRGKLPDEQLLVDHILRVVARKKDLEGKRVLCTAGPTREAIDPVRYISNGSSGKMGYALAREAMLRGARVTLVTGPVSIDPPPFVDVVRVTSAREMFEQVTKRSAGQDIIIKAAAVADYTPAAVSAEKIKKTDGDSAIPLKRTDDILRYLGEHRQPGQYLCGFSMETEHMLENSRAKLEKKHADMIVANNLKVAGAGFAGDTNVITILTKEDTIELELMSKEEAAGKILDVIVDSINSRFDR